MHNDEHGVKLESKTSRADSRRSRALPQDEHDVRVKAKTIRADLRRRRALHYDEHDVWAEAKTTNYGTEDALCTISTGEGNSSQLALKHGVRLRRR